MITITKVLPEKLESKTEGVFWYSISLQYEENEETYSEVRRYIKENFPTKYEALGGDKYSPMGKAFRFEIKERNEDVILDLIRATTTDHSSLAYLHTKSEYTSVRDFAEFILKYCDVSKVTA